MSINSLLMCLQLLHTKRALEPAYYFSTMSLHLLIFITLIFQSCRSASSSSLGNETDRFSLIKFKESISSDPYHIMESWNSSTHFCFWHGISCGRKHKRVTELVLDGYQLSGPISPFIGNVSFLRLIVLNNNNFHGEIPQELGLLFRLEEIYLENNTLTGEFPINVTRCSNLKKLSFQGNHLTGKIPMQIGSLHKLQGLYLSESNFTGEIPTSLWNLTSLGVLSLDINNLEGSIPEDLGRLKNLTIFAVAGNKFSGAIPSALYNLSSLTYVELAFNQFNVSLPTNMFSNLPNLQILELAHSQFSGPIPVSIVNASMLSEISIPENYFTGPIPNLGKLHELSFLALDYNDLGSNSTKDWEFLKPLMNCSELKILELSSNNFGGRLPNSIGNLSTQLTSLYLEDNEVYGQIPEALENLVSLRLLSMDNNHLAEIIPTTFGKLLNLQFLSLRRNKLSGEIIHFIGNLTKLFHLDLSKNMLEGQVPPSIRNCTSLEYLDLSQNNFRGAIVEMMDLTYLSILLNLSHNSFSGNLPDEVGKLTKIDKLDVSHNYLSRNIPQAIGDCQSLEYLFLQGNFFQETIPLSLTSLRGLRYLDLSQNNLSGSIPKGLQSIASLEYLNVSFNMLDGEVPSKGVFGNVSAISLTGNNKLCGGMPKLELPPCPIKSTRQRKHQNFKLIISICCVIAFLLLASIVVFYHGRKRSKKSSSSSQTIDMIPIVSYQSLHNATDGFSVNNLIGSGSFGSVYKGSIFEYQEVVAIKVINLQMRGAIKSFVAECNALKNAKHRNLVKIITCCSSIDYKGHEFKALVFEYMVNGNLENWLHPRTENPDHPRILLLDQILNILIDIVSALNYLHYEYEQPLVHCDLKSSNVLLDGNMVAHLSDFGLARLLSTVEVSSHEQSSTVGIKGTIGYVPPEYGMGYKVSIEGDMYSFGILVLEMLTKRKPTEEIFNDGHNLQTYVKVAFPNKLLEVVSPSILPQEFEHIVGGSGDLSKNMMQIHANVEKCLRSLFKIGLTCSMESPHERMSAIDVIKELNSIKKTFPLW